MLRPAILFSALCCIVLCAACSADKASIAESAPSAAQQSLLQSQLPPFPAGRSASVLVAYQRDGAETFDRSAGAPDEGTALRLASSARQLSWGVWGFGAASGVTGCTVDFTTEGANEAWFAVANYALGRWELAGPLPGPEQSFELDSATHVSPLGDVFLAVLSWDGADVLVNELLLSVDVNPVQQTIDFSGGYTSLEMVNGRPAISYYDGAEDDLRFVRANDPFGAQWGEGQTIDSAGQTGKHSSLAIVDGFPAIAYYDETEKDLRYVRALDADGEAWGLPLSVDGLLVESGEYCSLAVVDGRPAISYYHVDGPGLRYVRALDSSGLLWGMPEDVDFSGNAGQFSSLAVVDGFPAIAYRHGALAQQRYVRAEDSSGDEWGEPLILDAESNGGFYANLLVINGNPAICFYDGSDSRLRYMRASNVQGTTWGAAQTLDGADVDAGGYCSMALIGGLPAISYHQGISGDLRFVRALDVDGDNWSEPVLLDETSIIVGRDTSLLEVNGAAAVSYFDQTNEGLRYMWGF